MWWGDDADVVSNTRVVGYYVRAFLIGLVVVAVI